MRTSGKILLVLALIMATFLVAKNQIIKVAVVQAVHMATGFDMSVGKIDVGLFNQSVEIKDLRLYNPSDFPDREAFDIRRVYVKYDRWSLLSDVIKIKQLDIDIPKVVLVRKADGETNISRMKEASEKATAKEEAAEKQSTEPAPEPTNRKSDGAGPEEKVPKKYLIEELNLKLGTAEYRSFGEEGTPPEVSTIVIDRESTYTNIDGVGAITTQIANDILLNGGIQTIFENLVSSEDAQKILPGINKAMEKLGDSINSFLKKANEK